MKTASKNYVTPKLKWVTMKFPVKAIAASTGKTGSIDSDADLDDDPFGF